MASLPNAKTVTYEEWLTMPEVQDAIEEVVNGEIRIMPPAKMIHTWIAQRLRKSLERQLDDTRVQVFPAEVALIIRKSPLTTRVPDISVFIVESMVEKNGYVESPPQLVIEILSPANTRKRQQEKLADYAALGVPEVWVVSPEARNVEILLLEDNQLRRSQILAEGFLQPKLFPNVQIDITQIWPD